MTPKKEIAPGRPAESDGNTAIIERDCNSKSNKRRYGAMPGDWVHFDLVLGLTADLLPAVSNPNAVKSDDSSIKEPGKLPSVYNRHGEMVGIPKWTGHTTTADEITKWSKVPDYGICIQARHVRAIDVDVSDFEVAFAVECAIVDYLGIEPPIRGRSNANKFLIPIIVEGDLTKRRFKTSTDPAVKDAIELLASGQQWIGAGTHPSGVRYEWRGGLPDSFPVLSLDELESLWAILHAKFGAEDSVTVRKGMTPEKKRQATDIDDPLVTYLLERWTVHDIQRDGRVDIECPWHAGHSTESGTTSTSYFPAGVGGFKQGHYRCLHSSCARRTDHDFKTEIGYYADGFEVIEYTAAEIAEQAIINARNDAKKERAANAAIEKAKFTGGRSAFEAARRDQQKRDNEQIGQGDATVPPAEVITLGSALHRFVFLSDGSRVVDLFRPHYDLTANDWAATYAASTAMAAQPDKFRADGSTIKMPPKETPVSKLWMTSRGRRTAVCRTFKAGGPLFLADPEGRSAVNSWQPFDRSIEVDDMDAAGLPLLLDHVDFLFGADAGRFLDWLAHIEQNPGVLPHTSWLHIAKRFGMGRNWLASVLARVWSGSVAANLDLAGMMKSGFNGGVSRKVLAVVDEIREGGRDSQWEHSETLKKTITEETRHINPKYGRQSIEYNACRWLMFSNHLSAIPMENEDRRIEVVVSEAQPKGEDYYTRLYSALNRPLFVAAVAKFLGCRDIAHFNPGAHAKMTEGKRAATKASQTPMAAWCEMLVAHWPSDLITAGDLFEVLEGPIVNAKGLTAAHRKTLEHFEIEPFEKPIKVDGTSVRFSIVRNRAKWKHAEISELRTELGKATKGLHDARSYLEDEAAES